jgi:hypothetical protein
MQGLGDAAQLIGLELRLPADKSGELGIDDLVHARV